LANHGDDEQIEALKTWWKENGTSLLTGITIVFVVFFGVREWQNSQDSENGAASDLYQQIAELAFANMAQPISAEDLLAAQGVYSQLKTQFSSSIYVRYAALAIAKFQVEHLQLEQAASELQWILDNPGGSFLQKVDEELLLTTRLRLARVRLSQGQAQQAMDLLKAVEPGSYAGSYAEVEGDVLLSMGQPDAARAAYQRALAVNQSNPVLLQLKLQDLGVSPTGQL
jgi:predicted negative regulator of RcsB-dependent stress response